MGDFKTLVRDRDSQRKQSQKDRGVGTQPRGVPNHKGPIVEAKKAKKIG